MEAAAVAAERSWAERATKTLKTGAEWYRAWLFEEGREQRDEEGNVMRRGLDRETVEKVKKKGGKLSRPQLLRCRVRYFTAGVAIGSKSFIEHLFRERREEKTSRETVSVGRCVGCSKTCFLAVASRHPSTRFLGKPPAPPTFSSFFDAVPQKL